MSLLTPSQSKKMPLGHCLKASKKIYYEIIIYNNQKKTSKLQQYRLNVTMNNNFPIQKIAYENTPFATREVDQHNDRHLPNIQPAAPSDRRAVFRTVAPLASPNQFGRLFSERPYAFPLKKNEVKDRDILLTNPEDISAPAYHHPGNSRLREIIKITLDSLDYEQLGSSTVDKHTKKSIEQFIFKQFHDKGIRFLSQAHRNGHLYEMHDLDALRFIQDMMEAEQRVSSHENFEPINPYSVTEEEVKNNIRNHPSVDRLLNF